MPGFRHFLGAPAPSQRFRAFGVDPLTSPSHHAGTPWADASPVAADGCCDHVAAHTRFNRRNTGKIPSFPPATPICCSSWRMTWCIRRFRFRSREVSAAGRRNARRSPLRLETLYGSGPVGSPHIYALDAPNDDRRTKLRLGRMRWKENEPATGCPFRDIARTRPRT